MDCTIITHTNGNKEIRYWVDPVLDTKWIESYHYSAVPEDKMKEIKTVSFDRLQELLKSI